MPKQPSQRGQDKAPPSPLCHWHHPPSAAHAVLTTSEAQSPQGPKLLLGSGSLWLKPWGLSAVLSVGPHLLS